MAPRPEPKNYATEKQSRCSKRSKTLLKKAVEIMMEDLPIFQLVQRPDTRSIACVVSAGDMMEPFLSLAKVRQPLSRARRVANTQRSNASEKLSRSRTQPRTDSIQLVVLCASLVDVAEASPSPPHMNPSTMARRVHRCLYTRPGLLRTVRRCLCKRASLLQRVRRCLDTRARMVRRDSHGCSWT